MPAATGAEVRIKNGLLSVVDGPFVEAKEVIGGDAIFELPGTEEALASAKEFMQLHKDLFPSWEGTCELRAIASPPPNNPKATLGAQPPNLPKPAGWRAMIVIRVSPVCRLCSFGGPKITPTLGPINRGGELLI